MRSAAKLLVICALGLMAIGIVVLYSSSSARGGDPLFHTRRQVVWMLVAIAAGTVVVKLDYHVWRRFVVPLYIVTVLLLIAVFLPGIGTAAKGSARWIDLHVFRFQPSELAKLTVIVMLAAWMSRYGRRASEFLWGLLYPMVPLVIIAALVFFEPDYGATVLIMAVGFLILFAGGTRFSHLFATGVCGVAGFAVAVFHDPVRVGRVLAFVWPERYPDTAYHLEQSRVAFIMGGPFGVGLGNSMQKRYYLPEAHTDFILSILAEEKGFLASLLVLLLYVGILVCGMTIAMRATDSFGRYLAFGVTMTLAVQAAINIGVVSGCLPTTGLALPFISYGGSSMLLSVTMIAILLSIAQSRCDDRHRLDAVRDSVRHV